MTALHASQEKLHKTCSDVVTVHNLCGYAISMYLPIHTEAPVFISISREKPGILGNDQRIPPSYTQVELNFLKPEALSEVWWVIYFLSLHRTNLRFGLCLPKTRNRGAVAGWLVWPCIWDVACIMFHIKAIKMNQTLAAIPELPQAQAVAQGSTYPRQASPGLGNASAQAGARTWLQH